MLFFFSKIVTIYTLLLCTIFGPENRSCNFFFTNLKYVENVRHQVIQQLKFLESEDEAVLEMVWEVGEQENKVVNITTTIIIIIILRNLPKQTLKVMITLNNETKEATISADR